jgi:hypothetical protein
MQHNPAPKKRNAKQGDLPTRTGDAERHLVLGGFEELRSFTPQVIAP